MLALVYFCFVVGNNAVETSGSYLLSIIYARDDEKEKVGGSHDHPHPYSIRLSHLNSTMVSSNQDQPLSCSYIRP
ncbi:hypothetical protein F511_37549 [Dorcoceras hygrometricum]|uniref:Uncharacterized protein n=1 Tax=Dorcoceras hygrometricum TaxID=472368 RepID=A0A2Z7ACH3_9LAMI|nr:hypothetical protein F511_37549 [Dorcoceras hygrometricum]